MTDVKYAVEGKAVKRAHALVKSHDDAAELKDKINQCAALLLGFLKNQLEPQLTLSN